MEASCWHKTMIQMTQNLKINTSSCLNFWETHHANREVVVDYFIRHRIAFLFILIGDDLHTPAVHQHLRAPLDVFKYTTQILAVISFNTQIPAWLTVHKYSMNHWENFCWRTSKKKHTQQQSIQFQLYGNSPTITRFSPPPHRRHRARSFPVPRGSTATGGRTRRLALSDCEKKRDVCHDDFHQKLTCAFYRSWSTILTYCVENPANCSISPAHQDPVILQTSEETQAERKMMGAITSEYDTERREVFRKMWFEMIHLFKFSSYPCKSKWMKMYGEINRYVCVGEELYVYVNTYWYEYITVKVYLLSFYSYRVVKWTWVPFSFMPHNR